MIKLLLSLLTFSISLVAISQTTKEGTPFSWKGKIESLNSFKTMPSVNVQEQLLYDSINLANSIAKPYRFGYEHVVSLSTQNSGQHDYTSSGDHIWRLGIVAPQALSINLIFSQYKLAEGAKLYLYSKDRKQLIGAYTAANNNEANTLGTVFIYDEKLIIELIEPKAVAGQSTLEVGTVVHGYRPIKAYVNAINKGLNTSGNCNVDVDCPAGSGWEQQRNAVAMMVNGGGFCTGALVNNTANDGTPYFLTANHCGTNHSATVFRFRWESPNPICASTTNSSADNNTVDINGSVTRASNSNADFCLVELNSTPPVTTDPNEQIYYNGWDYTESAVSSGTGIHHPDGDIKKISIENSALTQVTTTFNGNNNAKMWQVADWDVGVTEPGSSGSPLYDQNKRQIGVLSGGAAACNGTTDNDQYDIYGRFGIAWDDAAGASNQLKPWLDPTNSNPGSIDGYDPNGPTMATDAGILGIESPNNNSTVCNNYIAPVVTLRNFGTDALTSVTILYNIDGAANLTYNWTGNLAQGASTSVNLDPIFFSSGAHNFTASTSNPNGNTDLNSNNDAATIGFNGLTNGVNVQLDLTLDCFGDETSWEIRDNSNVLIDNGGTYQNNQEGTVISKLFCLQENTCYNFIINDAAGDGLDGVSFGCPINGDYTLTDIGTNTILGSMIANDGDFGSQEVNNFCTGESSVSINENSDLKYRIYPNPSNEVLYIEYEYNGEPLNVQIIDITGKVVLEQVLSNTKSTLYTSKYSAGYYSVKLFNSKNTSTTKLIIK